MRRVADVLSSERPHGTVKGTAARSNPNPFTLTPLSWGTLTSLLGNFNSRLTRWDVDGSVYQSHSYFTVCVYWGGEKSTGYCRLPVSLLSCVKTENKQRAGWGGTDGRVEVETASQIHSSRASRAYSNSLWHFVEKGSTQLL